MEWKPIKEYFENFEKYDWVLVRMYDYNLGSYCIPHVAEFRAETDSFVGGWYDIGSDDILPFPVVEFFDMKSIGVTERVSCSDFIQTTYGPNIAELGRSMCGCDENWKTKPSK